MEVTVGDAKVLLTTHRTFSEHDNCCPIQNVAEYPPLRSYLERCADNGPLPYAVVIRQLHHVAHRIVGATINVVYQEGTPGGITWTQTLQLWDKQPAVLMPILIVDGDRFAVLARCHDVSSAVPYSLAAIRGWVSSDSSTEFNCTASLLKYGFDLGEAKTLSPQSYTVGNEGEAPVQLFTLMKTSSLDEIEAMSADTDLSAVLISEVPHVGDVRAVLAAMVAMAAQPS